MKNIYSQRNKSLIEDLKKLLNSGSCLCGHGERCNECDPFSITGQIKEEIRKIVDNEKYQ